MDLKDYISFLRKDKGFSQRELARRAQISHTEISRIEKGERDRPSPIVLKKLAPFLGVKVEQLMEAAGYISIPPGRDSEADCGQQEDFSCRLGVDDLPILSKSNGSKYNYLDLKSLFNLDFALWVADNNLASAGLYRGDLALCSRDMTAPASQVMVVESIGSDKLELSLANDKYTELSQVCEPGLGYCDTACKKTQPIGRVVAVLKNMGGESESYYNENLAEWLEAVNVAKNMGFTPTQVIWIIKKQAQFLKMFNK